MNFIEELYYGNIRPSTQEHISTETYKQATAIISRIAAQLRATLSESERAVPFAFSARRGCPFTPTTVTVICINRNLQIIHLFSLIQKRRDYGLTIMTRCGIL